MATDWHTQKTNKSTVCSIMCSPKKMGEGWSPTLKGCQVLKENVASKGRKPKSLGCAGFFSHASELLAIIIQRSPNPVSYGVWWRVMCTCWPLWALTCTLNKQCTMHLLDPPQGNPIAARMLPCSQNPITKLTKWSMQACRTHNMLAWKIERKNVRKCQTKLV